MGPLRIAVAGGSIGGLTAGVLLHELGHDVHVFERSTAALQARGAGIVVLPMTEKYFVDRGGGFDSDVALTLTNWSYVDAQGTVTSESPTHNRFSSWNTVYRALLDVLPSERYHLSRQVTGFEQTPDSVTVLFADGEPHECDVLVAADGIASTVRSVVEPDTEPEYAGYVAWRGTVMESELSRETQAMFEDAMVYQVLDHSHILIYAIPGPDDSIAPGERALNFVWYRNAPGPVFDDLMTDRDGVNRGATMPPGMVQQRFLDEMHDDARRNLAPQIREVVLACDAPFIQAIYDMTMQRFVYGRVVVIGDAACSLRPHVAAGTAKACADGWALRDHLAATDDLFAALAAWEAQQLAVARHAAAKTQAMGEASQRLGTMVPDDPGWRFGLFEPGN